LDKSLHFVHEMDPVLAHSLRYLFDVAEQYEDVKRKSEVDVEALERMKEMEEKVEAMCLFFTVASEPSIELMLNGSEKQVRAQDLKLFVALSVDFLLRKGIQSQVSAFLKGFNAISDSAALQLFHAEELEQLLCDTEATLWDAEGRELCQHIVCDHGYTPESRAIGDLIAILCRLSPEEQRLFVRFVTGSNRLPLGGLAKLQPKLTVVRKLGAAEENDGLLPSASTCTNYLKLPEYSSRDVMRERLLYCIREGQYSFHLS
jgi:E3 ubiquitin-protein ligase TRIP12